jgi:predicted nucleic acid-binding protein
VSKLNAVRGEPWCVYLSHGHGIIDALIGQLADSLDLTLHTVNQKHYVAIPGLCVLQPYPKD